MKKLLSILLLSGTIAFTGCGNDRDDFVVTNTNNVVVQAPVCANDAYATNANTQLAVNAATGVLTNDTPNGATVTFQTTSANGGTIVGNQDGSFTYTPLANFAGSDNFTYTLGNSGGIVTCTVTITVTAVNGFFVDATNGNDGTGSFTNGLPFATIQAAAAAAPAGSDIVVRPGNYTGGINLDDGDRLLGSGSVLAQGVVRPTLTGPVVLGDGCTVDFIRIANSPGDGIDGDDQNGGTVTNCEIDTTVGSGVDCRSVTGNWDVSNNTVNNATEIGIQFRTDGTDNLTVTVNDNAVTGSGLDAIGFVSANTSQCNAQVQGNTMTGNQANFTFEVLVTETAQFCLDLENNQNDDFYRFGIINTATVSVEQLQTGPFSVPGNTGTFNVLSGGAFADPASVVDGACGF